MSAHLIDVAYASSDGSDHWHGINWRSCYEKVRKMQARIVKATQENSETGSPKGLSRGLSRMTGNFHVRFLGEGKAAMPFSYPTPSLTFLRCPS